MNWHRHAYPLPGPAGDESLSLCAYQDGHNGPCDNPHRVIVLDPRDPDSAAFKALQRALDDQPGIGLRSLVHAVESLTDGAVA